jgi:hypothetical protein
MNPTPDSQQGDPVAVILARMEVKLDNALTEQAKHSTTLDRHDTRLRGVEDRLTVIESSRPKNLAAWAGVAAAIAAVAVAIVALFMR